MESHMNEAEQLREQLDQLLSHARRNQQTMRRFSEQELLLIGITSLQEIIGYLLYRLPVALDIETSSLILLDSNGEIARFLSRDPLPSLQVDSLMLVSGNDALNTLYRQRVEPLLSSYNDSQHARLFEQTEKPRSVALLPLQRGGRLIGSFHFGSKNPHRFTSDSATDFLQHLTAIIAVCLENCLNHARLQQLGLTDALTGVNNRRYFEQRLGEAAAAAQRHQRPLACIFVDVDHFKRINDSWGHPAGDEVLRIIARLINTQLRHCDVLCRYGGEEFVVLLPDTDSDAALEIGERIRQACAAHTFAFPSAVTISAGVAASDSDSDVMESQLLAHRLVSEADRALYQAKREGRDRVILCREGE